MKTGSAGKDGCDIIYMSHGGGPMPLLGDPDHRKMVDFLTDLPGNLPAPEEILVISAHWEEPVPSVYSSGDQHLLFDYYGFPPETYRYAYPTVPNDSLVSELMACLRDERKEVRLNPDRGLDHGVFVPLMLMYPDGGVPVTQLSLLSDLDSRSHLNLGRSLRPLRERNILIIGSGFSFHNMRAFSMSGSEDPDPENDAFQDWLIRTCTDSGDDDRRDRELANWTRAPGARYCHPREEHLLPLHVCAGLAGSGAEVIFDDYITGKRSVAFHWRL